ncbi:MAG: AAA family ATPase [Acidimicrobiia bacterium]|nr:AAA family ATPase [Acidimicrobiia bacterium]
MPLTVIDLWDPGRDRCPGWTCRAQAEANTHSSHSLRRAGAGATSSLSWLEDIVDLLRTKGQLIFYGPPGTGKTYVAKALARHLVSEGGALQIVQFHPSYSYEDFFEGYRPDAATDGGVSYELKAGPLRRLADAAMEDPTRPYILIVDEINRGNIPKIFGELLFLLEYRDRGRRAAVRRRAVFPTSESLRDRNNEHGRPLHRTRRRGPSSAILLVPFLPTEVPVNGVLRAGSRRVGTTSSQHSCSMSSTGGSRTTRSRSAPRTSWLVIRAAMKAYGASGTTQSCLSSTSTTTVRRSM